MGFMETVVHGRWWIADTVADGPRALPVEGWTRADARTEFGDIVPGSLKRKTGYGARLSAPGFLGRTDWIVFDSEKEARFYLEEHHGEDIVKTNV